MDPILYRREPPIAVISMNRPESLNAMNEEMIWAFEETLERFNADPAIRAGVLTGEGKRAFSAGHDTKEVRPLDEYGNAVQGMGGIRKILEPFTLKPLVAAVKGWCVGHGMDWLMHCDVVVAAEDARFSLPEARVGVTAGYVWDAAPHVGPTGDGLRLLLDGKPIPAAEAHRIGLVQQVVPREDLQEAARRMALELSWMDTQQAAKIKRIAYFWRNALLDECGQLGYRLTDWAREQWNQEQGTRSTG